jgi:hypothetical protein
MSDLTGARSRESDLGAHGQQSPSVRLRTPPVPALSVGAFARVRVAGQSFSSPIAAQSSAGAPERPAPPGTASEEVHDVASRLNHPRTSRLWRMWSTPVKAGGGGAVGRRAGRRSRRAESTLSGCNRARSVRTVSASTKASNQSSLSAEVAGRATATAQAAGLVRRDHQHGQVGAQRRVDNPRRPAARSRPRSPGAAQPARQPSKSDRGVLDGEPLELDAVGVHDRACMFLTRPVDPGTRPGRPTPTLSATLIVSALTVAAAGSAPDGSRTRLPVAH